MNNSSVARKQDASRSPFGSDTLSMLRHLTAALILVRRVVLIVLRQVERQPALEPEPEAEAEGEDPSEEEPLQQDVAPPPLAGHAGPPEATAPPPEPAPAAPTYRIPLPVPAVYLAAPSTGHFSWRPPASHAVVGTRWYCVWRGGACPSGVHGGLPFLCWVGIEERLPGGSYTYRSGCRLSGTLLSPDGRRRYSFVECVEAYFAETARHNTHPICPVYVW